MAYLLSCCYSCRSPDESNSSIDITLPNGMPEVQTNQPVNPPTGSADDSHSTCSTSGATVEVENSSPMAAEGENQAQEEQQPRMNEEAGNGIEEPANASDGGYPNHIGSLKQLHSGNGNNLAISPAGQIYGTTESYNEEAVLEFSSVAAGEVRIRGKLSQLFVAMNDRGKVYAEDDPNSENAVWYERFDSGYNNYLWKPGYPEREYFLGLKRSGKMKRGNRTRPRQKAVRFLPRAAYPKDEEM